MKLNKLSTLIATALLTTSPLAMADVPADSAIKQVLSYGFVDLEGAKVSAIIVEYDTPVLASSINKNSFEINDYTKKLVAEQGWDKAIARDTDSTKGNEGEISNIYVNDKPKPSKTGGTKSGKYVII